MTDRLLLTLGDAVFPARLERALGPRACAAFEALMPSLTQVVHVRWSGEAVWVPLGDGACDLEGPLEAATSTPAPGQVLLYPGGISETEVLIAYGVARFACKDGPLQGAHVMTIEGDLARLAEIGHQVMWRGATALKVERA